MSKISSSSLNASSLLILFLLSGCLFLGPDRYGPLGVPHEWPVKVHNASGQAIGACANETGSRCRKIEPGSELEVGSRKLQNEEKDLTKEIQFDRPWIDLCQKRVHMNDLVNIAGHKQVRYDIVFTIDERVWRTYC